MAFFKKFQSNLVDNEADSDRFRAFRKQLHEFRRELVRVYDELDVTISTIDFLTLRADRTIERLEQREAIMNRQPEVFNTDHRQRREVSDGQG